MNFDRPRDGEFDPSIFGGVAPRESIDEPAITSPYEGLSDFSRPVMFGSDRPERQTAPAENAATPIFDQELSHAPLPILSARLKELANVDDVTIGAYQRVSPQQLTTGIPDVDRVTTSQLKNAKRFVVATIVKDWETLSSDSPPGLERLIVGRERQARRLATATAGQVGRNLEALLRSSRQQEWVRSTIDSGRLGIHRSVSLALAARAFYLNYATEMGVGQNETDVTLAASSVAGFMQDLPEARPEFEATIIGKDHPLYSPDKERFSGRGVVTYCVNMAK